MDYTTGALQEYFGKNVLMLSPQTIIERSQANDFEFFLKQANFLKVVDTLEKF
jgi:hypothetical protein